MSGLGASILEEGIERGIEQGAKEEAKRNAEELLRNGIEYSTVRRCIKSLAEEEMLAIYQEYCDETDKSITVKRNIKR